MKKIPINKEECLKLRKEQGCSYRVVHFTTPSIMEFFNKKGKLIAQEHLYQELPREMKANNEYFAIIYE